jgi:hypothetical protein
LAVFPLALVALGACNDGQENIVGPSQPFRVKNGQFFAGALPGVPSDEAPDLKPSVTAPLIGNQVVTQGQGNKAISGRASADAKAVGLALDGVGGGYWLVPTGAESVEDSGSGEKEVSWSASADFDLRIPPGLYRLTAVAFDGAQNPGAQASRQICVASAIPDNLQSCDPKATPPEAVIALSWDSNVDLDLQVMTPSGVLVTPKQPNTVPPNADDGTDYGAAGLVDRDSNANCVIDGVRRESLVFQKDAPRGGYVVYANLFDACKQPLVRYQLSVYRAAGDADGVKHLELIEQQSGELLDSQVDTGKGTGFFVAEISFE